VNLLEKTIPKRIEDTKKEIVFFESNIQQAEERIAAPFPKEQELFDKKIEYAEFEMKLVEIDAHEDIYDPDDTPLVETAVEKSEREAMYKNDSDDYQPYIGNDDDNSNHKPKM